MSSEQDDTQSGIISMITSPSSCTANWFIGLSTWGLLLAILNIFGYVHPSYHYSWGGLFTLEFTNVAYELKSDSPQIVASDAIFIAICSMFAYFGLNTHAQSDDGIAGFFKGLFVNDTWPALASIGEGGIQRTLAAWCILLGFVFYAYHGISHLSWMDVGAYSVSIAFIAFGFALNHASRAPEGEDNLD
ncbi:MAG: hypothetical protein HOL72_00480 [Euryarchaeota archaeon]|jgi:hypothetical protein|nr:hypothetical protein [Euryarchaeota archaeon]MBT5254223.1 hypothetical protein [Euryarchaeota archaeon]